MRPELLKIKKADFEDKILSKLNKADKALFESNYVFDGVENVYNLKAGLSEAITNKLTFKLNSISFLSFLSIEELAEYLRKLEKRYLSLFAYNGTGKTRLVYGFQAKRKRV
jgi:hypothetical protein